MINKGEEFVNENRILCNAWEECCYENIEIKENVKLVDSKINEAKSSEKEGYSAIMEYRGRKKRLLQKLDEVKQLMSELYIGKIDITCNGQRKVYYVGNHSRDYESVEIVNWKSNIADLLFSKNNYYVVNGKRKIVEVNLKRKIKVRENNLLQIADLYKDKNYIPDEFLLSKLQETGKNRLQDLYQTIQHEQNTVLRAPIDENLIIQGAAGTGKTIVALHRLAYILYHKKWNSNEVVYISPNEVFSGYVNSIIPDIDQSLASSIKLIDLLAPSILDNVKIKFKSISVSELPTKDRMVYLNVVDCKGSLGFITLLDDFINKKAQKVAEDIKDFTFIEDTVLGEKEEKITSNNIRKWFLEDFKYLPLNERKLRIKDRIAGRLGNSKNAAQILNRYFNSWPDFNEYFNEEVVAGYLELLNYHRDLANNVEMPREMILWNQYFGELLDVDLAAIFYLQLRTIGVKQLFKHIVVDEAQLLSPLWLTNIVSLLHQNGSITLCGDINQNPFSIGFKSWAEVEDYIGKCNCYELKKPYRMTDEIVFKVNEILTKLSSTYSIEPIGRKNEEVEEIIVTNPARDILEIIQGAKNKYETFAIVTKTKKQAKQLYNMVSATKKIDCRLMGTKENETAKIIFSPLYLLNGLEFDVVIVADYDSYNVEDFIDNRLLYIAVTRASHKLFLLFNVK